MVLNDGIKTLRIFFKDTILYTNNMNVLPNSNELLKYIEIWNKIESLFNRIAFNRVTHNKKFNSKTVYKKYIKTRISSYNEHFHGNKRLTKDKYYGHSILLLESIYEVENEYYSQTFLETFLNATPLNNNNN